MHRSFAPVLLVLALSCKRGAPVVVFAEPVQAPEPSAPPEPAPAPRPATAVPLLSGLPGPAVDVTVEDGNVVVRDAGGRKATLTATGRDDQPSLSFDGKWVVYLHARDGAPEGTLDLYRVPTGGGTPELLLADDPAVSLDDEGWVRLNRMRRPTLSLDGKRVFFGLFVVRSDVVCTLTLATKKVEVFASTWGWMMIPRGPYRGDLLVMRHEYYPASRGGSYEMCYVTSTRTGKDLRRIGCDGARGVGDDPDLNRRLGF